MKYPSFLLAGLLLAFTLPSFAADEVEKKVFEKDWVTITVPETAVEGEEVTAEIKVHEGELKEDAQLNVDLHTMIGNERQPAKKHVQPVAVPAGQAFEHTAAFMVPEGVDRIGFIVYAMPPGGTDYKSNLKTTEVWVKIVH